MFTLFRLQPEAFGLDISDHSVKMCRLVKHRDEYRLNTFGEFSLPEGVIVEGEVKKDEELAKLLEEGMKSVQGKKLDTRYVVASLPEEKAFLQVLQLPKMKPEEVRQAILFEAENYIPYPLETVYLDYQIVSPFAARADDHFDVLIASWPRVMVDQYIGILRSARMNPLALEIESFAIARAVIPHEVSGTPVFLVDLGASRTGLSVYAGYSLQFTASAAVSSSDLTNAIAKTLQVSVEKAEKLKFDYGMAGSEQGKEVFDALIPSLTDLAEQIKKYIDYYETHALHQHLGKQKKAISKVFLCGGGAVMKGLPEFLSKQLNVKVQTGNPWVNIRPEQSKIIPPISFDDSLRYTTALGLALRGARAEENI
ncbi:MAG: hypothetical protein A3E07_03700 [Candidatus Wildermuthbacteria bacterium RIFCSPHIGHO2_12_FULL_45_9]|uniref:SHS2 domain-containing protein n=1 Tax=Candidatus Wildermuthbacteria bacterium RIFCSPHIGHO2_02_FULL_45_25 TaxID=1802450 RepID=A0A1G2R1L5_9BACT|nr:MAG: hypothetical protein A2748_02910 [Candidatus Wildermuthbacteria bacterium RIFCSPHIGHO2_01_FULL_45_20]OHA66488.1 MAG: hypothetical protein A3C04_04085 [Candidatus Wildermuthbacteria bacterium RIFCSPHIGHO2_02_FULL_45_25]OHA71468.1 MAG: hypothetical protein A3E07_03700 [Candidatus Wildermuthbacteria bacterium RIFCSPHIGHO2_12_FULL_45_9]